MPLPVPVLDDLAWAELVEQARDRIPSSSPRWTDHNAHDPGITILELLAAACEQTSFRIDRIPRSHRAAFLALLGITPEPAAPATAVLQARAPGPIDVVPGRRLIAEGGGVRASFTVERGGRVGPAAVSGLRVRDSSGTERTVPARGDEPFEPLGPDGAGALIVELSPVAPRGRLSMWFAAADSGTDSEGDPACDCGCGCGCDGPIALGWEWADGGGWRPLAADAVDDGTSGLRRSGVVTLTLPSPGATTVRCSVRAGRYDRAPALRSVWCNPLPVRATVPGVADLPAHPRWTVGWPPASVLALTAPLGVRPGREAESLDEALGRAAVALSAHERLVDLAQAHGAGSLDVVPADRVRACAVPARAVTLLDIERIALATPGTRIARVRAFAGVDLDVRCADAPGTVSVVVVPFLPAGRPEPTSWLLGRVRRRLARHRTLGTRITVSGPAYTRVDVAVAAVATTGADRATVRAAVERAVRGFLDPLAGGPHGRGWPFGRDVYRTEVMTVLGAVPGVDLVTDVRAVSDRCDACPNACVPDGALVAVGSVDVEVT